VGEVLSVESSEALLYATCRIVARRPNGSESIGTGFFFSYPAGDNQALLALVTNKHVVRDTVEYDLWFHLAREEGAKPLLPSGEIHGFRLRMLDQGWFDHPSAAVDLCATPIEPFRAEAERQGKKIFLTTLSTEHLPTQPVLNDLLAMETVTMIGYPIGLWDQVNNFPLARRGMTATHPKVDFDGKRIGIVDIAAFPGSSGSPVLLVNQGGYAVPGGRVLSGSRILLLGILYAGPQFSADGEIEIVEVPTSKTAWFTLKMPMHLGYYIKAEELLPLGEVLFSASSSK
jgi:V8-like Glu-specific endopeptidase